MFYRIDEVPETQENVSDKHSLLAFKTSDEMLNSICSLLKDELDRYMGFANGTDK